MKRVLFDHNVPAKLARYLKQFDVQLADDLGCEEIKNGRLLRLAENDGFHVLLTGDQGIKYEQNMAGRQIGVVSMSDNHWQIVRGYLPTIVEGIEQVRPGEVREVFCGRFVAVKFRNPTA